LGGYSNIHITSESEISDKYRSAIDEISSNLVGVESGGIKKNSIILRNVVYSEGVKYQNFVSTLMEIAFTMHENILEALQSKSPNSAKLVSDQDKKINPKNYAITRMMNTYLQDLTLTGVLEISLIEAQSYFAVSLFLESMGDNAVLISKNVIDAIKFGKESTKINDLINIFEQIVELMGAVFSNWENKNKKGIRQPISQENTTIANNLLDKLSNLNKFCKKLMVHYQKDSIYSVFYGILEKLRQSIKILSNIALVTIDIAEGILKNTQNGPQE
jgi:phosphate uptake regulator